MRYDFLSRFITLCIGLGFSATVWAASGSADLMGLPWGQIGVGALLALWGGLTHTAQRLVRTLRAGDPVEALGMAVAVDLLVSIGNGFVVYLIGAWQEWGVLVLAFSLFCGGYAGTRLLDAIVDAVSARIVQPLGAPSKDALPK